MPEGSTQPINFSIGIRHLVFYPETMEIKDEGEEGRVVGRNISFYPLIIRVGEERRLVIEQKSPIPQADLYGFGLADHFAWLLCGPITGVDAGQ